MTEKTITITCTDDASANLREAAERRKIRGYRNLRFTGMTDLEFAELLSPYQYNVDELFETGPDGLVEDLFDTAADKDGEAMTDDEALVDELLRYGRIAECLLPTLSIIVELNDDLVNGRNPSCVLKAASRARDALDVIITGNTTTTITAREAQ